MTTCQHCSVEMSEQDRFCRKCGAPVATLVGDLVDTRRFNPDNPASATAQSGQNTNPFYVRTPAPYPMKGHNPYYQTDSLRKKVSRRPFLLLIAFLLLLVFIAAGVGIGARVLRGRRNEAVAFSRRSLDERIRNSLGFSQRRISSAEFPGLRGIFVDSLTDDDSPAARAGILAGDVLIELNGQLVGNAGELSRALDSLAIGVEVPVTLFRDGEMITSKMKPADQSVAPIDLSGATEQGYLGVSSIESRRRIPGTDQWGVEIGRPARNEPADLAGLLSGDLITHFDGHPTRTRNELLRRIWATKPRSNVLVRFYRGNIEQTVELTIGGHRR